MRCVNRATAGGILCLCAGYLILTGCGGAPPEELAAFVEPAESAETQVDFRERLHQLAEAHGIEITWQGGPYRFEGDWGWGEAKEASEWEIGMFTPILAEELSLYPRDFLKRIGITGVILGRDLWLQEEGVVQNIAGYIFDDKILMSVSYTYKVNNRHKQRRYLHHLIWHQFDTHKGMMWEDPEWTALNPPDFKYGMYTKGGIHDRSSESGLLTTRYPGFVNRYSTGYLPDDKADVFAYLMVTHHWVEARARQDRVLREKVALMKKRLAEFDSRFDADFWARVDAIQRDVKPYVTP